MFSFAATKRLNILNHSRKDFFSSFIPFIKCYIGTVVAVWSSKSYTPSNHIMISVHSILHKTNCYWDGSVPDRCQCVMALGPLEASLGPIVCTWRRKSSLKIPMFKKFQIFFFCSLRSQLSLPNPNMLKMNCSWFIWYSFEFWNPDSHKYISTQRVNN